MKNNFYFYFKINSEQIRYAKQLVQYSIENHNIPNIWDNTNQKENTVELRFTGTLGEVLFADVYGLKRPTRSFGSINGQDLGKDFQLEIDGKILNFDIKTMRRNTNIFYSDYVFNIPSSQLNKPNSLTDMYFHININPKIGKNENLTASFVGFVSKYKIKNGKIGKFYSTGTWRIRRNGTKFMFNENTYEVDLIDLCSPPTNDRMKQLNGFGIKKIIKI